MFARPVPLKLTVMLASTLALVPMQPPASASGPPSTMTTAAAAVHVLNRLAYGPRPGDIAEVQRLGVSAWIERQLHPERIDDRGLTSRLTRFETLTLDADTLFREYHQPAMLARRAAASGAAESGPDGTPPRPALPGGAPGPQATDNPGPQAARRGTQADLRDRLLLAELSEARLLRAVYSERQLEEVLVDFWFNHFNVFAGKGPIRAYVTAFERDTIRPHVLGSFREMLEAVASSPAMLFYLDNWQNVAADAQGGSRAADAQRRRRAADTQSRGRAAAAQAGARMPRGINENYARELLELHTLGVDGGYTQEDIVQVARAFTGWTMRPLRGPAFVFSAALHDRGEKRVLGHTITAGGIEDGRRVLDILVAHPSTARFIATKLAQRFVSDAPSPALVERAARRFRETGGDLREVTRTIVTSPEFHDPAVHRAKVKTPLEFVASALRATGADLASALPVVRTLRDLGQPLYFCQPPTGYEETGDTWVSSGALVSRMNFALEMASGRMRGIRLQDAGASATDLATRLSHDALADQVSEGTRATVARATTGSQVVALLVGSPEFQRQ